MSAARKSHAKLSAVDAAKPRFSRRKNLPLRKSALSATAASRRSFPAWIDADDTSVAFTARTVSPRVRDGLVLRIVRKSKGSKKSSDVQPLR